MKFVCDKTGCTMELSRPIWQNGNISFFNLVSFSPSHIESASFLSLVHYSHLLVATS